MFERDLTADLKKWTARPRRKPLILRGARQVGKTSLVKMFAKNYTHFIHLNLDKKEDRELFENELDIHRLFEIICLHKQIKNIDGSVLLFIDEIQNSPRAVAALRYFYEEKNEIHVLPNSSRCHGVTSPLTQ